MSNQQILYPFFFSKKVQLLVLVLVALLFTPGLFTGFAGIAGDDNWMVYENPNITDLSVNSIQLAFTTFYRGQYSPLNTLVYMIIFSFVKFDPFWYHIVNLVFHIINIILVYWFIVKLLSMIQNSYTANAEKYMIAFFTALLFALHPMQVESVTWISASKIVFYSTFFLASLIAYMHFITTKKWQYYFISLVFFIISFGFKEQAVILPAVLLLINIYIGRAIKCLTVFKEQALFASIALGFGIVTLCAQQSGFAEKLENYYYPFGQRIVLACFSSSEYLFKLLLPIKLSFSYGFPIKPGESLPYLFLFYPVVMIALLYFLWMAFKAYKYIYVFGYTFFFVCIFLSLHLVPMARSVLIADRYIYLGSIGIFYIISTLTFRFLNNQSKRSQIIYLLFIGLYVSYLGAYTWIYSGHWK